MIDEKDFSKIKKELELFDSQREELIKQSRDILKLSKHAIYSIHNDKFSDAKKKIASAEKIIAKLDDMSGRDKKLASVGALSAAMQEYVEAKCYFSFVTENRIVTRKELGADAEDYLLGICDLTGELGRRAVLSVIAGRADDVYIIRGLLEKIHGLFLDLNLRNGELRKKSDSIKWNLKKVEDIIYDLKTRGVKDAGR